MRKRFVQNLAKYFWKNNVWYGASCSSQWPPNYKTSCQIQGNVTLV